MDTIHLALRCWILCNKYFIVQNLQLTLTLSNIHLTSAYAVTGYPIHVTSPYPYLSMLFLSDISSSIASGILADHCILCATYNSFATVCIAYSICFSLVRSPSASMIPFLDASLNISPYMPISVLRSIKTTEQLTFLRLSFISICSTAVYPFLRSQNYRVFWPPNLEYPIENSANSTPEERMILLP